MPEYKLVYFDMDVPRMMFQYAGQDYEDQQVTIQYFRDTVKDTTPMGQLPMLIVDGKKLCQSNTIIRYLAKQLDLQGSTDWEAALCDMYACGIEDMLKPVFQLLYKSDNKKYTFKRLKELNDSNIQPFLAKYGDFFTASGSDWMVGSKPTYIDFMMHHTLTRICKLGDHKTFVGPHEDIFKPYLERISSLPAIHNFLMERPKSEMYF